jgi:hypothetical protein
MQRPEKVHMAKFDITLNAKPPDYPARREMKDAFLRFRQAVIEEPGQWVSMEYDKRTTLETWRWRMKKMSGIEVRTEKKGAGKYLIYARYNKPVVRGE